MEMDIKPENVTWGKFNITNICRVDKLFVNCLLCDKPLIKDDYAWFCIDKKKFIHEHCWTEEHIYNHTLKRGNTKEIDFFVFIVEDPDYFKKPQ